MISAHSNAFSKTFLNVCLISSFFIISTLYKHKFWNIEYI